MKWVRKEKGNMKGRKLRKKKNLKKDKDSMKEKFSNKDKEPQIESPNISCNLLLSILINKSLRDMDLSQLKICLVISSKFPKVMAIIQIISQVSQDTTQELHKIKEIIRIILELHHNNNRIHKIIKGMFLALLSLDLLRN